jgi:hypothetical protein
MFRKLLVTASAAAVLLATSVSLANTWLQGQITEIQIMAIGNGQDAIYVKGNFATGCTENGFAFFNTDVHFKETYAALLAAKVSGTTVKFLHVYCMSNGYARGNGYSIAG